MTPVEAVSTSFTGMPSAFAVAATTAWQSFTPCSPVKALALPLLTIMARLVLEVWSAFRLIGTVGDTTWLSVNTPAAVAGTSETISARSLTPFFLRPQATPPARNPGTRTCFSFFSFIILNQGNSGGWSSPVVSPIPSMRFMF